MEVLDSLQYPLNLAFKEIEKQRERIKKIEENDVEACKIYMEMARTSVDGLGKEAQSILLQARKIDSSNKGEIDALIQRIDKYLYTDNLRPALNDAISGLKGIGDAMTDHAKRFLQWPWVKKNRKRSVENFQKLLGLLTEYLQGLQNNFLPGGSGMLVVDLYKIKDISVGIREGRNRHDELLDFIDKSETDRSRIYDDWLDMTGKITEIFEKIRTSIR